MSVTLRKKIISWLGVIGSIVQFLRYCFRMLSDSEIEMFAFVAFILMAVDLPSLIKIITTK